MAIPHAVPHYEITRSLRAGLTVNTYLTRHRSGELRALKVFMRVPSTARHPSDAFCNELSFLATLAHPHLIALADFGQTAESDADFIATRYIDGHDFVSASRTVSRTAFVDLVSQLCSVLQYLHGRGVVHGDLKPTNVLIEHRGQDSPFLHLLDLGCSSRQGNVSILQGSPAYMAPELIEGKERTPASDLYSLGVMLYECLSGVLPFDAPSVPDVLTQHLTVEPRPLDDGPWSALNALVLNLLSKTPGKRPPSAADVRRSIVSIFQHSRRDERRLELDSALRSTPLQGRTSYLAKWDAIIATETRPGQPTLVLLTGPLGSGKSRLCREMAIRAKLIGHRVACLSRDDIQPHQSFVSELTEVARDTDILILDGCDGSDIAFLHAALKSPIFQGRALAVSLNASCIRPSSIRALEHTASSNFAPLHWTLDPLTANDIDTLIADVSTQVSDGMALPYPISAASGGNPGIAGALLARSLAPDAASQASHTLVTAMLNPSPELALHIASLRLFLSTMSDADRLILELLSGILEPLAYDDVASLSHIAPNEVSGHCTRLAFIGLLLRDVPPLPSRVRVASDFVRAFTLTLACDEIRLMRLTQVAQWYLSRPTSPHSLGEAGRAFLSANDLSSGVRYTRMAADLYFEQQDFAAACRHYDTLAQLDRRSSVTVRFAACTARLGRLSEAWNTLTTIDTDALPIEERLNILTTTAWCARLMGKFHALETISRQALALSHSVQAKEYQLVAMLQLGTALCWLERPREGLQLLARVVVRERRNGRRSNAADALQEIASSHWKAGRLRTALKYAYRAFHVSPSPSDAPSKVPMFLNIGVLRSDLGHFARSRKSHRAARAVALRAKAERHVASAATNIGETYRQQGQWPIALRYYRIGRQYSVQCGSAILAMTLDTNMALVLCQCGYYGDSLSLLKHSLRNRHDTGSGHALLNVLFAWASYLISVTDFPSARKVARFGANYALRHGVLSSFLSLRTLEARALDGIGDRPAAKAMLDHAIETFASCAPFETVHSARLSALQLADIPDADTLERFIATSKAKRMHWHLGSAILLKAQSRLRCGHQEEVDALAGEVLAIARLIRDRALEWQAHFVIGQLHESRLAFEQALASYRIASLTIHELTLNISDDRYKRSFLLYPMVRDVLERYDRLRSQVGRQARHDVAALSQRERSSRQLIRALSTIGHRISSILTLDTLLPSILETAIETVSAERGIIFLKDSLSGAMRVECIRGHGGGKLEATAFSQTVIRQASEGRGLLTVDVGKDVELSAHDSLVLHGIKSILCVPMRTHGRVTGIIYLDTRKTTRMFTEREKAFIESFASQAAIAIENARLFGHMQAENARLRRAAMERGRFENIVGTSPAIKSLSEMIGGVLDSPCNVLIVGESGTGKELVARAIHCNGPRHDQKFIPLDCGALPEALLEAELFGHARGAFTGAERERIGLIEAAHGGTLFLDEITNLGVALQSKLLRVLQEREIRRLGENAARPIDVRVLAATNADIEELVAQNRFRQDLYYRLNVVKITVPPLRDRREDIPLIVDHFLRRRGEDGRAVKGVAPEVMTELARHDWPGNVRELENVVERLAVLSPGTLIRLEDLRTAGFGLRPDSASQHGASGRKTGEQIMIEDALRRHGGDKAKAARFIGWNRQKLYRRMKSFRIPADFGQAA